MNENGETNKSTNVLGDAWVMKDSHISSGDPLVKPRLPEYFNYYLCSELLMFVI